MNKHQYAIIFALVGAAIGALISDGENGQSQVLGIVEGMGFGCFVGYFIAGLITANSRILSENFRKLGDLRGLTLNQITKKVGPYQEYNNCYIEDIKEWGYQYTWRQNSYSITLLFGADGKCIGMTNESVNFN